MQVIGLESTPRGVFLFIVFGEFHHDAWYITILHLVFYNDLHDVLVIYYYHTLHKEVL